MPKNFKDLSEREILALAISLEEEDIRTYSDIATTFQKQGSVAFPDARSASPLDRQL